MLQTRLSKTINLLVFLTLSMSWHSRLAAQDSANTLGHVSISSPTAASLGKYGDIPVSYHTGIPQINIPLYTVKAGTLSLPISLDYHASGLKVTEPAGWVGAGWSLNAGGVITRTVVGLPDEKGSNAGSVETNGHFSDYGFNNYLYNGGQEDWMGFASGRKDGEPDLFFFNFGGYSGKFYFRDDRTPIVVPQQDLKIVPYYPVDSTGIINLAAGGASIQGFTVTTPDGTQYLFGNTPGFTGTAPIEVTNPYTSQAGNGGYAISGWYLNKVVSADGQFSITLTYTPENYGYFTLATFPVSGNVTSDPFNGGSPYEYNLVKNIISGVRLSQISFPNGTVSIQAGAVRTDLSDNTPAVLNDYNNQQANALGAVQIADGAGFCKKYQFYYGYFTDNTTPLPGYYGQTGSYNLFTDKQRLRLDSLQEISCDGVSKVPPYKFSYFTEQVPRRLSFGLDHWGFPNGVTGNNTLIPTFTLNGGVISGANRDAAWPAMRGGTLNQINYPTGGTTTFNFETNTLFTTKTSIVNAGLLNLVAHLYSQSNLADSGKFTCTSDVLSLNINNTTSYTVNFVVTNSSNAQVYSYSVGNNTQLSPTFSLPAGTYTGTVSIPSNANLSSGQGVQAQLTQQQQVTSQVNVVAGGLRIQSIVSDDGSGLNPKTTTYSYTNPSGQSTGVLYSIPVYVQAVRNDIIAKAGYWSVNNGFVVNSFDVNGCPGRGYWVKSGGSLRPMSTVQGNPFGYSQVTVTQSGNGYSVYNYYTTESGFYTPPPDVCVRTVTASFSIACDPSVANYPPAPLPLDYKRGELYYEQHYNNTGHLLKDIYYYPAFDTTSVLSTPAFIVNWFANGSGSQLLGTKYDLWTVRKTKMMTVEDDYDMNGSTYITRANTVYYGSPFHNEPTRTVVSTSSGDSLVTNTQYAFDFRVPSCDAITNCTDTYSSSCASCLSTYNSASTACAGSGGCLATAYLTYLQCLSTARVSYDSCRRVNYVNPTNAFGTCHTNAKNSADTLLKPILRLQDMYQNAPIEVSDWRDGSLRHASFTRYDTSLSPLGFAYPGRTKLINLPAPSTSFTGAAVSGSTISKDSRYVDESFYTFSTGNPQQVTDRSGVPSSYVWDYVNTKPIAKVMGATVDQVAYTSFEADGNGSWTIGSPNRDPASAITGNQSYNLTGGACSRSGLTSSSTYIVSYWSKTGSAYLVSGSTSTKQGKTITINSGTWTYFEHVVTGVGSVTVSGSGNIDELRLYPATAQMTTYTYSPLIGISSQCDVGNRISYYTYDGLGRLKVIKDQDGNIIKTIDYHYQGQ